MREKLDEIIITGGMRDEGENCWRDAGCGMADPPPPPRGPPQTNQAEKFARISKCKQTIKSNPKPQNVNKQLRLSIPNLC